jgi:DNA-binding NarL/FixJ family response regulator
MGVGDESILAKMQINGGPEHLLTNRGNFTIGEDGLEEEEFKHQEDLDEEWNERMGSTSTEEARMKELHADGKSYHAIAKAVGKSVRTVRRRILGER